MASNFLLAPGEDFVQCPYNLSHRITNMKFLTHLAKCRDAYLKDCKNAGKRPDMDCCRYNKLHQFPKPEKTCHETRCPNRYSVIPHIAYHQSQEFQKIKSEREAMDTATQEEEQMQSGSSSSGFDEGRERRSEKTRVKEEKMEVDDGDWESVKVRVKKEPREHGSSEEKETKYRDKDRDRDHKPRSDRDRDRDRDYRHRSDRDRDRDRDRRDRDRRSSRRSPSPYDRNSKHKHKSKSKREPTPPPLTTADLGDENWDEDCREGYEPGYDPKVKLEAECILYNPCGLKKAERRQFRLDNRKKAIQRIALEEDQKFTLPTATAPMLNPSLDFPTSTYAHVPSANGGYLPDLKPTILSIPQQQATRAPAVAKPRPVVTAPPPIKRDPDEPYEEGEIEDEPSFNSGQSGDKKSVGVEEDYDWNSEED